MGPSSSPGLLLRSLEPKADPFFTMEDYINSDKDLGSVLARFPREDMGKASLTAPCQECYQNSVLFSQFLLI